MSVNKVFLLGRIGKDPELTYTNSGTAICKFSIATNEKYKDKETTTWHNIVAWGKQGEVIKEFFVKGQEIFVDGKLSVQVKDDGGDKKYYTSIIMNSFSFVGNKAENKKANENNEPTSPTQEEMPTEAPKTEDDDLPF